MKASHPGFGLTCSLPPFFGTLLLGALSSAVPTDSLCAQDTQDAQTLDNVVVTATITENDPDSIPTTVSLVDADTIEQLGAVSVDQALEEVPGLEVEMGAGRITSPKMRGTNTAQTLLLLDGRRLAAGFKRMTDLNQILAAGVDRIEVVRGPASALYGSEAVGGVVNIITKKGPEKEYEGILSTQGGSGNYDDWAASLSGGASTDKVEAYGSFGMRNNNSYESGDGAPTDVDEVHLYGGFMNADVQVTATTTISGGAIASHCMREGMRAQNGGSLRTAKDDRFGGWLELEQKVGEKTTVVLRTYEETYKCDISMVSTKASSFSKMKNTLSVIDGHVTSELVETLSATIGGELRKESYDDQSDTTPKDRIDNSAGYAQVVWKPVARACVIAGTRVDEYDGFGTHTSPQISAMYGLPLGINAHAGWSGGFRAPNSMELHLETYENSGKITVLPNADLDPESSHSFEVGLARPGRFWRVALTYFHTEVKDMIEEVTTSKTTKQWQNLSSVKIDGVELENTLNLCRYASLENYLCWLDPKNEETGCHVEGERKWSCLFALAGRMPEWGLKGRVSIRFGSDEWGADDTKTAHNETVDARVEKSFLKHWKVYVGVRDATDDEDLHYYGGVSLRY
jgi:outer membrane receptor for ferrienterochelin and colicins